MDMDVPLNVKVICLDGECGKTTTIILNPVTSEVTHTVVKDRHREYLVPMSLILGSTPDQVELNLSREELTRQEAFIRTQFIGQETPDEEHDATAAVAEMDTIMWPYNVLDDNYLDMYMQVEQIPHDELAIHRGANVEASDGHIGRVDEFILNPSNNHITHLVLREGHIWDRREVTVPLSSIDRIDQDTVFLNINKKTVRSLPSVKTRK